MACCTLESVCWRCRWQQAQTQARQVDLMERWVRTDEKVAGLAMTVDKHDARIERLEQR